MKELTNEFVNKCTELKKEITETLTRSAWKRGIAQYVVELLENLVVSVSWDEEEPTTRHELQKILLNGASDWLVYSNGGLSLIFDQDIAERLCTASELKRTKRGQLNPNRSEDWIDVQARALYQAYRIIEKALFPNC